jgi:hypothetical protein
MRARSLVPPGCSSTGRARRSPSPTTATIIRPKSSTYWKKRRTLRPSTGSAPGRVTRCRTSKITSTTGKANVTIENAIDSTITPLATSAWAGRYTVIVLACTQPRKGPQRRGRCATHHP